MPNPAMTLARQLLLTGAALLTAMAWAQSPPPKASAKAARPDPLDARAVVPAARYVSPLAHYRRLDDSPPLAWKEANDAVARIGGWRAYAREAQQAPASAGDAASAPAPAAHPGQHRP